MPKPEILDKDYEKNVFINCPYDDRYEPLFIALVFAVHDLGFKPRCALEASNFGKNRLDKIVEIIAECKYSIHDLSRTELDPKTELPRFNMAFELGIDLGCSRYGSDRQRDKISLVMDVEELRYRGALSDVAGQDIYAHQGVEEAAVGIVWEWLSTNHPDIIPTSQKIYERYDMFQAALPEIRKRYPLLKKTMQFKTLSFVVAEWLTMLQAQEQKL